MIRILFVLRNNIMHGTERFVIDLARTLPKDKFEVYIGVPMAGPICGILKNYSLREFIYFNGTINKFTWRGIINLGKFITREKIHIVHSNCGIIPSILGSFLRINKTVETRHGLLFTKSRLDNLRFVEYIREYSKQHFLTDVVAISDNDRINMVKHFGYKLNKISVIYNGIDIDAITRTVNGVYNINENNQTNIRICNVGRICFQKAQEVLIDAMELVHKKAKNIQLTIIGSGENKNFIEQKIREDNLQNVIKIEDYREDIYTYLKTFRILVLTSRFEGVPYVVLEAMALGVPVISTNVGGVTNILRNGENGLLTKVEDPEETASAILSLSNDAGLYNRIRYAALNDIKYYSLDRMAREYEDLYTRK